LRADGADAKRRLRSTLATRRGRVSPRDATAAAISLADAVLEEPRIRRAERVALYAALDGEIPTRALFDALQSLPIVRLLPRFERAAIVWGRAEDWDALTTGRFGILEPVDRGEEVLTPNDVVLLPGVAFDRNGWRLGRGGGHYDREFPPGAESPWLVGVGYSFQWLAEVPHDSRDRRVDAIVTENGWVWRARGTT
jgi:5-formyltetrahydrofolate cyclo-ligase